MGGVKYIGYMVPIVLILVLLEWQVSRLKGKKVYQFNDTIVNMCCGMLERLFDLFFIVLLLFLFEFISESFTIFKIPSNAFTWLFGLLVTDFLAYWHHRLSHEINFLWAAHVVHHQSEELNLSTVFRVSAFAVTNRAFFFIWLPIIGFSPALSTSLLIIIGLFQFLTHTRLIGKLGFLEYIFVTPSSHRVHHGCDQKYIDKNYGHVFIFWDRLFGTYYEEEEEPNYGITEGFESYNAYWAYLAYWKSLFSKAYNLKNWKDKIQVFLKPPSWTPTNSNLSGVKKNKKKEKYILTTPVELQFYILMNIIITLTAFVILLINKKMLHLLVVAQLLAGITLSILTIGLLMDQKAIGWKLEAFRLIFFSFGVTFLIIEFNYNPLFIIAILLVQTIFAVWLIRMKENFNQEIQPKRKSI